MADEQPTAVCLTCGAVWSTGEWTEGCAECGGGALKIPCPVCSGRCGNTWHKAIMDSNDFGESHWHGVCALAKG